MGGVLCVPGLLSVTGFSKSIFTALLFFTAIVGAFASVAGSRVSLLSCRRSALVGEFLQFSRTKASHTGGFLFEGDGDGCSNAQAVQGAQKVELSKVGRLRRGSRFQLRQQRGYGRSTRMQRWRAGPSRSSSMATPTSSG